MLDFRGILQSKNLRGFLILLLGALFFIFKPSQNDMEKRKGDMITNIPNIIAYNTNVKIKDKLIIDNSHPNFTSASAKFSTYADEEKILKYYTSELKKYGWNSVEEKEVHNSGNQKRKGFYGKKSTKPNIEVWLYLYDYDKDNKVSSYDLTFHLH